MQITDSYQEIIETMDFIDDQETARSAVKAVLGMITSSLNDQEAKEFTARLPDYLDYETLRDPRERAIWRSPDQCVQVLQNEFNLEENEARALMQQVVAITVREAKGEVSDLVKELGDEWAEVFNQSPR